MSRPRTRLDGAHQTVPRLFAALPCAHGANPLGEGEGERGHSPSQEGLMVSREVEPQTTRCQNVLLRL